jgi:hypothetical protein
MSVYRAMRAYREATDRADCPLSATARQLWANLAGRADYDGACWPTVETLCIALAPERIDKHGNPAHLDRGTVQRATTELIAFGVLDVLVARGRGRNNTYRVALAAEENAAPARHIARETPHQRGIYEPVDISENAALVRENAALTPTHIGEVAKRSRREASPRTIEENAAPARRFEDDAKAQYDRYAAKAKADGKRVLTPAVYFAIMSEGGP